MASTMKEQEYTTTVSGVLVDEGGAMICLLSMYDGETHYCRLTPIADIQQPAQPVEVASIYDYRGWLTDLYRAADGTLMCCDANGSVHIRQDGEWRVTPTGAKSLRTIWSADGRIVFTAGIDGRVFSNLHGDWQPISDNFGVWLNDIHGLSDREVMVAGDTGFAATWDGRTWGVIELPTSANLNAVHALDQRDWIMGGENGALFRGADDNWSDLTAGVDAIFAFAKAPDALWLACGTSGAGVLAADGSVTIRRDTFAARRVDAAGRFVAFAGNDVTVRHDGENWKGRGFR